MAAVSKAGELADSGLASATGTGGSAAAGAVTEPVVVGRSRSLFADARLQEAMANHSQVPDDEFSYRPVPVTVPIAGGLLVLSILAFVYEILALLPLIGACLAFLAWRKIRSAEGQLGGQTSAFVIGLTNAIVCVAAVAAFAIAFATEVPEGFKRVSFTTDISSKGIVTTEGISRPHPDVVALDRQPLFIKGYMYPSKQTRGLNSFVLCRDSGECCFGGQPKLTDMVLVMFGQDNLVDYQTGLVSVAGDFFAENEFSTEGLNPIYRMNAKYFSTAKTGYK